MSDDDNVFRFGAVKGGKDDKNESIPENNYVVTDIDNEEFYETGFLIFTPHHLAIMRDMGKGPVPALVLPIVRVKAAEIADESLID